MDGISLVADPAAAERKRSACHAVKKTLSDVSCFAALSIRVGQTHQLVASDASLPLSMTREETILMACRWGGIKIHVQPLS